jgi:hypothetical protein
MTASVQIDACSNGTPSGMATRFFAGAATYSASPPSVWMPTMRRLTQISLWPARQLLQVPSNSTGKMHTRSSVDHSVTASPTPATVPAISWPSVIGRNGVGVMPSTAMCTSEPHSPVEATRTSTSSARGVGTGIVCTASGFPTPSNRTARIPSSPGTSPPLRGLVPGYGGRVSARRLLSGRCPTDG